MYMENAYEKTSKNFREQHFTLHGLPQTVTTNKSTAFFEREFRDFRKPLNINLIFGTPCVHTPTGLVEMGIKTLRDYLRLNWKRVHYKRSVKLFANRNENNGPFKRKRNTVRTSLWSKTKKGSP